MNLLSHGQDKRSGSQLLRAATLQEPWLRVASLTPEPDRWRGECEFRYSSFNASNKTINYTSYKLYSYIDKRSRSQDTNLRFFTNAERSHNIFRALLYPRMVYGCSGAPCLSLAFGAFGCAVCSAHGTGFGYRSSASWRAGGMRHACRVATGATGTGGRATLATRVRAGHHSQPLQVYSITIPQYKDNTYWLAECAGTNRTTNRHSNRHATAMRSKQNTSIWLSALISVAEFEPSEYVVVYYYDRETS